MFFFYLNVFENVVFGFWIKKMKNVDIVIKVKEVFCFVNLEGYENREIKEMLGG